MPKCELVTPLYLSTMCFVEVGSVLCCTAKKQRTPHGITDFIFLVGNLRNSPFKKLRRTMDITDPFFNRTVCLSLLSNAENRLHQDLSAAYFVIPRVTQYMQ